MVSTPEEVQQVAGKMCGYTLVSQETGKAGFICKCVYIIEQLDIEKELYMSITLDRKHACPGKHNTFFKY